MTSIYYNEMDPYAAQWLRNLIDAGHIPAGDVDERSIEKVTKDDIKGYTQCHFFAGIGVWAYALKDISAEGVPLWTGSCPCQPFSQAGKGKGTEDERHLWPTWFNLIQECNPPIVFGEQVASKGGLAWFDTVQADLEGKDYTTAAFDLCAAGFSGSHIRQRLYFVGVANSRDERSQGRLSRWKNSEWEMVYRHAGRSRTASGLGNTSVCGHEHERSEEPTGILIKEVGDSSCRTESSGRSPSLDDKLTPKVGRTPVDWLYHKDGKLRPVEPGTFPLVNKATSRMGRLRAYGNALDAQTAKEFVAAALEEI